jgi:hypothetical protein
MEYTQMDAVLAIYRKALLGETTAATGANPSVTGEFGTAVSFASPME